MGKIKKCRPYVYKILPGSIAEEIGIGVGDIILSVNGEAILDTLDYGFLTTEEKLYITIEKNSGDIWEIDIEKEMYEDLGVCLYDPTLDSAKTCSNKCIFCFIDQLPKGMRETLYVKDDDIRLSFLTGNYVTLTNASNKDIDRILRYHLSPINISVHTTNPALRKFMLGNRFAGNIMEYICKLTDGGIKINTQIVLCKGINDGAYLDETIFELSKLYPGINSISVVPVGITKYREGLFELLPYKKEEALYVIKQIKDWQNKLIVEKGSRVVYAADEFYVKADLNTPDYEEYEEFSQLENGVGLITMFKYEFYEYLSKLESQNRFKIKEGSPKRTVGVLTGKCAYKTIYSLAETIKKRYNNLEIKVYPIENTFFGEYVTVAGLLTGQDIINGLKDKKIGDRLLIPETMLKKEENLFLDNYTISMVEKALNTKIKIVKIRGQAFIDAIIG
jgi:putative radical SAM enzyme (TIGR03279 family)